MRTLILLRHAKSDYPVGVPDVARPLALRGERDAAAAGLWLRAAFPRVDEVVVSPATRAQQTWQHVAGEIEVGTVRVDDRIYADWGSDLPDVVADLAPKSRTAMIVGHNPGIEEFALRLSGALASAARERLERKFPTSGIAIISVTGEWAEQVSTQLSMFAVPRG